LIQNLVISRNCMFLKKLDSENLSTLYRVEEENERPVRFIEVTDTDRRL